MAARQQNTMEKSVPSNSNTLQSCSSVGRGIATAPTAGLDPSTACTFPDTHHFLTLGHCIADSGHSTSLSPVCHSFPLELPAGQRQQLFY